MWIFAYGSLVFRPAFAHVERRRAFVRGYSRRFWQGSPDHRGVPEAPGRVVTLVKAPSREQPCGGCAYRIDPLEADPILTMLDHREVAGFERHTLELFDDSKDDTRPFAEAITWIAGPANAHFLGELPETEIAAVIALRRGPSGPNRDYVLELQRALRDLDVIDEHVETIATLLKREDGTSS